MSTNDKSKTKQDGQAHSSKQERGTPALPSPQWIEKREGNSDNRIRNTHESPKNQQREDGGGQQEKK